MPPSNQGRALTVADVRFCIQSPFPTWSNLLDMRYRAFFQDADECDWRVELRRDLAISPIHRPWIEHDANRTSFHVAAGQGCIHFDRRLAHVSVANIGHLPATFERTLVYILIHILPRHRDALLLHACSVQLDGRGFLFAGPSDAGKTTIARLAQGRGRVLGDENIILHLHGDGVVMLAAPFWGQSTPAHLIHRRPLQTPLHAIFLLHRGAHFALTPLRPAEAAFALLRTEKVAIDRVNMAEHWLHAVALLTARVPVYRLDFPPTPELWDFLANSL